jgi:hypothetical protein
MVTHIYIHYVKTADTKEPVDILDKFASRKYLVELLFNGERKRIKIAADSAAAACQRAKQAGYSALSAVEIK